MLEFPAATEFGGRIPKGKFYEKADISATVRRMFVAEIESVVWLNKFSPDTLNVVGGADVTEIELLRIALRQKSISSPILEAIVAAIPYHLLFLCEYRDEARLTVAYAPPTGKRLWYSTPWQRPEALSLHIRGLNLDNIYENFVRQIAGSELPAGESLAASAEKDLARKALLKRIAALTRNLRSEKQFNRRAEINRELRAAKGELGALNK